MPYPKANLPSAIITEDDFISSYKAAKESTSSSPLGQHIGHYKAIVNDPILVSMHASMMSIPFQVGIVPERWKRVTDIMLEKTPGDSRCHRLRIIALFESDLKHAKRILIGRKIAHHLEDNKMISEMQFGSRSGRRCLSAVLKKNLCHEYIRLSCQTAGFIEIDATGCYDRIMNNLILMVLRKLGLPLSVSTCMGTLWDAAIHLIKMLYGTSDVSYGSTKETPLCGPGQGSMCGSLFWLLCYWLIVGSLDKNITALKFISVCKAVVVEITGVSFVDDTGLGVTSTYSPDLSLLEDQQYEEEIKHVVFSLMRLAQHWERTLFTTGGVLNLQKSFWYLMSWGWKNGVPYLLSNSHSAATVSLTSGYNTAPELLPRIEPSSSFRTLGVYLSPSGCQKKQCQVLRNHAQHYYDRVQFSSITPTEALLSFFSLYKAQDQLSPSL